MEAADEARQGTQLPGCCERGIGSPRNSKARNIANTSGGSCSATSVTLLAEAMGVPSARRSPARPEPFAATCPKYFGPIYSDQTSAGTCSNSAPSRTAAMQFMNNVSLVASGRNPSPHKSRPGALLQHSSSPMMTALPVPRSKVAQSGPEVDRTECPNGPRSAKPRPNWKPMGPATFPSGPAERAFGRLGRAVSSSKDAAPRRHAEILFDAATMCVARRVESRNLNGWQRWSGLAFGSAPF